MRSRATGATGRVYEHLYDQIVHGGFAPNTPLSEQELATQMNSSRTPIREALLMLEGAGLVKRYPGRSYQVTEITPQDVDEIFELRIELEQLALRKAYPALGPELLQALKEELEQLDRNSSADSFYHADRTLHELLASFCGSVRLQAFLNTLDSQIERVRYISACRPDRLMESRREHLDIIQALIDKDLPLAEEKLVFHIQNVGESTKMVCRLRQNGNLFPAEYGGWTGENGYTPAAQATGTYQI